MDWGAFHDGMRDWVARSARIQIDDVIWRGEPLGMLGRPCIELNLDGSPGYGISDLALNNDEVRYVAVGPGQDAQVRIVGNRAVSLIAVARTRDGTALGRAFRYLERLRDALYLPSTQKLFADLGIGIDTPGILVDIDHFFDRRKESMAQWELRLLYAYDTFCECGQDTPVAETIGTIEHVRVAGTVYSGFNRDEPVIQVPEKQIDK